MSLNKELALKIFSDTLSNYFYYDRKECEDLNREEIDKLVESGELTIDDLTNELKLFLLNNYGKTDVKLTDE